MKIRRIILIIIFSYSIICNKLNGQDFVHKIFKIAENNKNVIFKNNNYTDSIIVSDFNFKKFCIINNKIDSNKICIVYYNKFKKIRKISYYYKDSTYYDFDLYLVYKPNYIFLFPILKNKEIKTLFYYSSFFLYDKKNKITTLWRFEDGAFYGGYMKDNLLVDTKKINLTTLQNVVFLDSLLNPIYRLAYWDSDFLLHSEYVINNCDKFENITFYPCSCNNYKITKEIKLDYIYNLFFLLHEKCEYCKKEIKSYKYKSPTWISIFYLSPNS